MSSTASMAALFIENACSVTKENKNWQYKNLSLGESYEKVPLSVGDPDPFAVCPINRTEQNTCSCNRISLILLTLISKISIVISNN